jgi:NitT/TauT family transport system ATP-binding protein
VMGTDPGRIRTIVENRLPRPRDYRDPQLLKLVDSLHDIITGSEMPDVPEAATAHGIEPIEPLPPAGAVEMVALLEWLDGHNGAEDVFRISAETNQRFDKLIQVVKAAEMLDFVDTPQRQVALTALGRAYVAAEQPQRKEIWRKQLLTLVLFRKVQDMLLRQADHQLEKEVIVQSMILEMPHEHYEQIFRTLVAWARFGDLFAYDARKRIVSMQ